MAGFLAKARLFLIAFGGIYVLLIAALIGSPFVQRHAVYMHAIRAPFGAQYDLPENYGLAPFKTANIYLPTPDNETLGAWFTLSEPFYAAQATHAPITDDTIRAALHAHPTILFFHGNAGTRAIHRRVACYKEYSARLRVNFLAIDYRGFADSTGTPSEEGLAIDARAAWDWLAERGAEPGDVLVMGNSLGTGVAVNLVSGLEADGVLPRGLVLLAPFSAVETLLDTYHILGLVPLLAPLKTFPFVSDFTKQFLRHRFDSLAKITTLKTAVLLAHAEDDFDIPFSHSETIFDAFLEPHLPALPIKFAKGFDVPTPEVLAQMADMVKERTEVRSNLVKTSEIERLGKLEVFAQSGESGDVVFLRTKYGGHDRIGLVQGVQDVIGDLFGLH